KCKFFHRFINSEFETKWTGFWDKTKKYLEYFAIKVNDEWLSKDTQTSFVFNDNIAIHFYETKDFIIREEVKLENALIISLRIFNKKPETKNLRIEIEFAVNFRNFDEGIIERNYTTEYYENKAIIKSSDRRLIFKCDKEGIFIGNEYYKIHYPSNQPFKCFLPKRFIVYSFIEHEFNITYYFFIEEEKIKKFDVNKFLTRNKLETNIEFVNELYKIAILNLRSCFDGNSFIAGYPWYAYYWGRDAAFSVLGASLTSMQDYAKKTILFFFKHFNGKLPNFILDNKISYNSQDALPLFIIALYEYLKNTSDLEIIKLLKSKLENSFEFYKKNSSDHGFIYSASNETWLDTLNREGYNLEIQVFWYKALKSLAEIFKILNNESLSNSCNFYAERLKENILKYFIKDNVFIDNLNTKKITINSIFPFVFDISKDLEIFRNIENHLREEFGFLSLSKYDKDFDENEYQRGASWFHMNALVSYVYFKFGKFEEGIKMLRNLYDLKDSYCKNCLIEVYNARNKNVFIKKPIGIEETSYLQAWSAASVIFAIQKGLLGLNVNSLNRAIYIKPYVSFSIIRKISNDFAKISFFNNKVSVKSLKGKNYKLIYKFV
ncbi:MAG: amylo-alpha-1,6-glucosidase, partial [Candidatus Aenigmatarchaeota archaeon]